MVEETVWVEKEYVRPRLSSDEVWLRCYCTYKLYDDDGFV